MPPADALPVNEELITGRFDGVLVSTEITIDEDGLIWVEDRPLTPEAKALMPESERKRLVVLDQTRLIAAEPERGVHDVLAFRQPDPDGRAGYLFRGGRLTPRAITES